MSFYPSVRDESIMTMNVIVKSIEADPNYLNSPECPYSDIVKDFFRKVGGVTISGAGGTGPVTDLFEGEDEILVLDTQIMKVINDLEAFSSQLTGSDVTEKMAYFRTKTALIEKLVNMREKLSNLKEINDFRETLLGFMNEICTKDQITTLMHRLDGILGTKNDDF